MWQTGEAVAWRETFRGRVWHALSAVVVRDSSRETVVAMLPGAQGMVHEDYPKGKKNGKRRWDFKDADWTLETFHWHTNRALQVIEPGKFYSTVHFWDHASDEFLCYYVNFQLPFNRNDRIIDTLDLDLDLVVRPDYSFEWKDVDDYEKAVAAGVIAPEWSDEIETAKTEIFERIRKRAYPLDGSWLDWKPDPRWAPAKLPPHWNEI